MNGQVPKQACVYILNSKLLNSLLMITINAITLTTRIQNKYHIHWISAIVQAHILHEHSSSCKRKTAKD